MIWRTRPWIDHTMSDKKTNGGKSTSDHKQHWCQHPGCKKWAPYGYDGGQGAIDWFCMEHRPKSRNTNGREGALRDAWWLYAVLIAGALLVVASLIGDLDLIADLS
jgi:hypothetical protein